MPQMYHGITFVGQDPAINDEEVNLDLLALGNVIEAVTTVIGLGAVLAVVSSPVWAPIGFILWYMR